MSSKRPDGPVDPHRNEAADEAEIGRLLVGAGPRPPLPADDLEQIRAGLRAAWRAQRAGVVDITSARPRRWRPVEIAALAATLAAAIGLTWWLVVRPQPAPILLAQVEASSGSVELVAPGRSRVLGLGESLPVGAVVRTADGAGAEAGRLALRLTGGTALRVDAGSRVRLESSSTVALEQGAIYVDSGSGRSAPIEVLTPLGRVRELGTRFAVRLAGTGPALVVRVREGAVAAASGGRRFVARRGQELIVHADGSSEIRPTRGWGPEWAWVIAAGPRFASEGRTVGELLDWVAAETGWRVELADEAARRARGVLVRGDIGNLPADRAAFVVLPGASLHAELHDGTLVVRAAR